MWLKRAATLIDKGLTPVVSIFGKVGGWALAAMMLLTVSDITGRYLFNKPISGTYEVSALMLALVSIFSLVYCQYKRGHISIDLVTSRFGQKTQNVLNSIMYVFYLGTFALLTYQLTRKALMEWETGTLVRNTELPVSPFVFVAAFGSALFTLIVLVHLLVFLAGAVKR